MSGELHAALDAADRAVDDLCSGRLRWEMRVPAEPDHDPDLIISKALGLARAALAAPSTPEPSGEDVERLRQQNHDAAVRHDREVAELRSKVARYENAFQRATELVRGSPVDWTDDPPSKEPDGWWRYTSQQNREVIAAAVLRAAPSTEPALDAEIAAEAERARAKFGDQLDFTDGDWLAVLTEEVGEAATETLRAKFFDPAGLLRRSNESGVPVEGSDYPAARLRAELVQVAAVARRWIGALDARLAESQP